MDTAYWNLFWTTGMPEAWLMSRDQAAAIQSAAARSAALPTADGEEKSAALGTQAGAGLTGGVSAAPKG